MFSTEKKYRAYKDDQIGWSLTIKMWLGTRRWVIAALQNVIDVAKAWSLCR